MIRFSYCKLQVSFQLTYAFVFVLLQFAKFSWKTKQLVSIFFFNIIFNALFKEWSDIIFCFNYSNKKYLNAIVVFLVN